MDVQWLTPKPVAHKDVNVCSLLDGICHRYPVEMVYMKF